MNNTISKVLACMLVITLTCTNLILLGTYATSSYAAADELEQQETLIKDRVEFDTYFLDDAGKKVHSKVADINQTDLKLYVSIEVLEGYLQNANINMQNANFIIEDIEHEKIQAIENNIITLNEISKEDKEIVLEIPIKIDKPDKININNFSKENSSEITGTLVTGETGITGNVKNIEIKNTITVKLDLHGDANIVMEQGVTKYTVYQTEQESGVILQTIIRTGLEENKLPIKLTMLETNIPTLKGEKPAKINVTANSLEATRADEKGSSFTEENRKIYEDEQKIKITVENQVNEQNEVTWSKEGLDEYVITYVYPNQTIEEGTSLTLKTDISMQVYNNEETILTKSDEKTGVLEQQVGNIATFSIETTSSLSKGYMYHTPETETEYQTKWTADLGYVDIIDDLELNTEADIIGNEDNSTVVSDCTYYKSTIISKDNFTKIFGDTDEAYIEIWNASTNSTIATINKVSIENNEDNVTVDKENNIVVNYEAGIDNIYIVTSKPVKEGKLEIVHNKAVKVDNLYSKHIQESIRGLTKLTTKLNGAAINNGTEIDGGIDLQKEIRLEEPQTKIELIIDNTNLSTVVTNENVNIQVVLKNNDISTDLYKKPVVEVVLPTYVENILINSIDLLYEDEMKFTNKQVYKNANGNQVIIAEITGEQTKYNINQSVKGATLSINADITANKLTPSLTEEVEVYVSNENAVTYENEQNGRAYQAKEVNFVAPVGMVTVNSITGYNGEQKAESTTMQEALGELPINSTSKTATANLTVINNYQETCRNISILGRLPFSGNKNITSSEELGSNLTLKLVNGITALTEINANNISIYYSTNGEASKDIENDENNWKISTEVSAEELANVKSYLIVLNNYEMATGSQIDFTYNIEIPANLPHNQTAYTIYTVYFDQDSQGQQAKTSAKVGLSTMQGPEIEVNIKSNTEDGAKVSEGQIIKYTVEVKNIGDIDAQNLKVISSIPEGAVYVKYIPADSEGEYGPARYEKDENKKNVEVTIASLASRETKTIEYEVQVLQLNGETGKNISSGVNVTDNNMTEILATAQSASNEVIKGYLNVTLTLRDSAYTENAEKQNQEEEFSYLIDIKNVNSEEKTNVVLQDVLPDGITFLNLYIMNSYGELILEEANYNEQNRTLTTKPVSIEGNKTFKYKITCRADKLPDDQLTKKIDNFVTVTCNESEETIKSNIITTNIVKPKLEIKQYSDIAEGNVSEKQTIQYNIEIKNVGSGNAKNVKFLDYIPDGIYCEKMTISQNGIESVVSSNSDTKEASFQIESGQTVYITLVAQTKELEKGINQKEVTNIAKVSADNIEEIEANKITHIINSNGQSQNGGNSGNNNEKNTYKITGTVWQDNNENGSREDNETTLSGIPVTLINSSTASKVKETTTDVSGRYEFTNLEAGRYIVAFMYDSQEYMVTTYQAEGVNESRNSDAIDNTITVDGEILNGAVTNNINLTSSSSYNIDLGLILRNRFDLSLNKSINKITVKTTKGTENYTYDEGETLAKIDIAPKRIEGANVVIEYKITVQNNGTIPGVVNKVVDYLPKELKFSSELNSDWYEAEDGNIYSASLADTLLNPGESQELTLVLTKTMTGENTGLVHNTAEIYEAYNDWGIEDINSTPGNKIQNENDTGFADVLLTVNTGEPAMYITLTIVMLALFATGAYFINKKVLRK